MNDTKIGIFLEIKQGESFINQLFHITMRTFPLYLHVFLLHTYNRIFQKHTKIIRSFIYIIISWIISTMHHKKGRKVFCRFSSYALLCIHQSLLKHPLSQAFFTKPSWALCFVQPSTPQAITTSSPCDLSLSQAIQAINSKPISHVHIKQKGE